MPWRIPATGAPKTRKLTEQTVEEIRHRWAAGGVEQQQLAVEYGVSTGLITALVRGVIWKHAPGPIMPARHRSGVPHIKVRLPAEVGSCVGCGRVMIRHRDWRESPELWRARGAVHCAGNGRCVSCADKTRRVEPKETAATRKSTRRTAKPAVRKVPQPVRRERLAPLSPVRSRLEYQARTCEWCGESYENVSRVSRAAWETRRYCSRDCLLGALREPRPRRLPLAELVRLRRLVGLPAVLPTERAS